MQADAKTLEEIGRLYLTIIELRSENAALKQQKEEAKKE